MITVSAEHQASLALRNTAGTGSSSISGSLRSPETRSVTVAEVLATIDGLVRHLFGCMECRCVWSVLLHSYATNKLKGVFIHCRRHFLATLGGCRFGRRALDSPVAKYADLQVIIHMSVRLPLLAVPRFI